MKNADIEGTTRPVRVTNAFSGNPGTSWAIVDGCGTVLVWDSVAGYYTSCHSLTSAQVASVKRRHAKVN